VSGSAKYRKEPVPITNAKPDEMETSSSVTAHNDDEGIPLQII
jgi:hypothetical protein